MSNGSREELKKHIRRDVIQYAIFRPESAVVIALTLILMAINLIVGLNPNSNLPTEWWMWLIGGGLAELALIYSSLTDPSVSAKIVEAMFREKFKPEKIEDKDLQKQLTEAMDYRGRIAGLINKRTDTVLKDSLNETVAQIDEWLKEIYGLAQRLDEYKKQKEVLDRNNRRANERLQQLRQQLKMTNDVNVQQDIQANINSLQQQMETNSALHNTMERARLRLENTITAMGTIYSQTMLFGAKDIDSGRAQRLRQEIADEVTELGDILVAMDEVYSTQEA